MNVTDSKHCNCSALHKKICYICDYEYEYFFKKSNVVGIALGFKIKNGFYTCKKCIKVFVSERLSLNRLKSLDLIPQTYKGIPTDVVETGILKFHSLTNRIRPVIGGYSIGSTGALGAGSMGCLVTDNQDNYILGNNHLLADFNKLPLDTPVIQPALDDGGKPMEDVVAILSKFIPLKPYDPFIRTSNYADCATAKVINKSLVSYKIAFVGSPKGTIIPRIGQSVVKVGRTTEYTKGVITDLNGTEKMYYKDKVYLFKKQIITSNMSASGDSGSVLLDHNNYVIGLLMGGGDTATTYNNIGYVLKALEVRIVTS